MNEQKPGLLGLQNSNRDFADGRNWGKNIFNNAFPAALLCYMRSKSIQPVYITLNKQASVNHGYIEIDRVLGLDPTRENATFAFESDFTPFRSLVNGSLPRADLVMLDDDHGTCKSALEIKLTALPDNSTYDRSDGGFGCELVIRPDTVVYLALNIASNYKNDRDYLLDLLRLFPKIDDWSQPEQVLPTIPDVANILDTLFVRDLDAQRPFVLQPVWKTQGRSLRLHEDAFDVFVWSDYSFTRLFFRDRSKSKLTRGARSIAWLAKMLLEFAQKGKIDHRRVIDGMSFNTKNDKAFAVNGRVTHEYMASPHLTKPRLGKHIIREIILGGGEKYLSPERRLDAAILSTPELFG